MGSVYRARRLLIGDDVAVKVLHREYVDDEKAVERFRREAQAAAMLRHPTIVAIYDFSEGSEHEPAYIVMEFVEGRPLRKIIELEGALELTRAVRLLREVCKGVGLAHRLNVVHRDIKPDNIMVLPPDVDDGRERVKVVDFGIAKLRDMAAGKTLTQTGRAVGTVYYMSPEQCCAEPLDARSDVYSLGAVLYEMLSGSPPFTAETATAIVAKHLSQPPPPLPDSLNVPPAIETVINRALAKEAAKRQSDASGFRDELGAAMGEEEVRTTSELQFKETIGAPAADNFESAASKSPVARAEGAGPATGKTGTSPRWLVFGFVGLLILAAAVVLARRAWVRRQTTPTTASAENAGPWQLKRTLNTDSKVYALAFSPGDRLLATASSEFLREDREFISEIKIWNAVDGQLLQGITEHSEGTLSVAFSPDGGALASATGSGSARNKLGKVKLWDPRTGALKWAVSGHSDFATAVCFSPDGKTIASGSRDHTVKLWDAQTGSLLKTLTEPDEVNAIAFSASGKIMAIAGKRGVELWDLETGELQQSLSGTTFSASAIAFSGDDQLVAGGDLSGKVSLWNAQTGGVKQTFNDHTDVVSTLAFSPDGKLLASGSYDGTVIVWNLQTGGKLTTLADTDRVTAIAFSHSGRTFASGGSAKTVKLWSD